MHPGDLGPEWDWRPGRILLGHTGGRLLGLGDDRHMFTMAGARAGKTSTVLKHNLARWPGSVVVLDPKGELFKATHKAREAIGQRVYVLDPFGITGVPSASYNPFDDLGFGRERDVPADAALVAEAIITAHGHDPHWSDAARNLTRGITLFERLREDVSLGALRRALSSTPAQLSALFESMVECDAYDGIVANIGTAFLGKLESSERELAGILSTGQEQTTSLDDVVHISETSDFRMADLAGGDMTLYVILPGMRIGTHYRYLRLIVQMALAAVERNPVPRGRTPVLFMLEEFPALGNLRSIEAAAGLMAGYGIKLWTVIQDLSQLKTHYPNSWETFLGNAGVVQAFANADVTTTEHLSKLLGMTMVTEHQTVRISSAAMSQGDTGLRENLRAVRLLEANEITRHFARETNRQLIIVPGKLPTYLERMPHYVDPAEA
jgi:type IV secretion system protein VirD4